MAKRPNVEPEGDGVIVIGIDQGLDGALAVLDGRKVIAVHDLPTVDVQVAGKNRREHAPVLAVELLRKIQAEYQPELCALERLHAMAARRVPGESLEHFAARVPSNCRTNFSLGAATYTYLTACAAADIPVERVNAQTWKRAFGLGKDKDASRKVALELFPGAADWLRLKKHHDRAEAILIAEFTRRKHVLVASR